MILVHLSASVCCVYQVEKVLMYQVLAVHTAASVLCFDLLKTTKSLEYLLSHFPITTSLLFAFTTFSLHALFAWILSAFFC